MEQWKDIKGYEGKYQISSFGRVRSLLFCNNRVVKERIKLLKTTDSGNGYYVVYLSKNGSHKRLYVHRLVASAFIPNDNCYTVVNHKDYNKHNNNVNNLEWCTQKENVLYSVDKMKHEKSKCKPTNTGEKYIRKYRNSYRVQIHRLGICKQFKTLEEAKEYKRLVMI